MAMIGSCYASVVPALRPTLMDHLAAAISAMALPIRSRTAESSWLSENSATPIRARAVRPRQTWRYARWDGPSEPIRSGAAAAAHRRHDHRDGRRVVEPRQSVARHHAEAAEGRLPHHPREPARNRNPRRTIVRVAHRRSGTYRHRRRLPAAGRHAGYRRRRGDDRREGAVAADGHRQRGSGCAREGRRTDGRDGRVHRRDALAAAHPGKNQTGLTRTNLRRDRRAGQAGRKIGKDDLRLRTIRYRINSTTREERSPE